MSFAGSEKPITGLILLVYARKPGGYGFNEFEMSNSTISTVFRQPLNYRAPSTCVCEINALFDSGAYNIDERKHTKSGAE